MSATMTKRDRKQEQLNRHYFVLEQLAYKCGILEANGKKLSLTLWKLEQEASRSSTAYCNGELSHDGFCEVKERVNIAVQKLFKNNLEGYFFNSDPRGYALKINDEMVRGKYADVGLHRDMGGYGILSPVIDGDA